MDRREMFGILGTMGAGLAGAGARAADEHGAHVEGDGKRRAPLANLHAHFCGIHMAKKDPKFQIVTQHYCAQVGDGVHQCLLFDSCDKGAKLIGVEYIISDDLYRALKDEEKKYWHPHTYEVLAGGLIAPGMKPEDEMKVMKVILNTWGKTWHTWPDPKTPVPLGEPLLIWSLMADGQADEKVVAARDKEFGVSTKKVREERGKAFGLEVPKVSLPKSVDDVGRQWTDEGDDKPTKKK
ncbi:MAG TPA: DUF1264 domain-containing protein [Gemmataceae bacterium]|nr:DUF1264 domain-containing protein [Gemmataceae bacterium]